MFRSMSLWFEVGVNILKQGPYCSALVENGKNHLGRDSFTDSRGEIYQNDTLHPNPALASDRPIKPSST